MPRDKPDSGSQNLNSKVCGSWIYSYDLEGNENESIKMFNECIKAKKYLVIMKRVANAKLTKK